MINEIINQVIETIPPYYSLQQFIAVNPLDYWTKSEISVALTEHQHITGDSMLLSLSEYYCLLDEGKIKEQALAQACKQKRQQQGEQFPNNRLYDFIMSSYGRKLAKMLDEMAVYEDKITQKAIEYSSNKCYQLIVDSKLDESGILHLKSIKEIELTNNLDMLISGFIKKHAITKSHLTSLIRCCVMQLKGWLGYFKSQKHSGNADVLIKLWLNYFIKYSEKEGIKFNEHFFNRYDIYEGMQSHLTIKMIKYFFSVEYPHLKTKFDDYKIHQFSLIKLLLVFHNALELSCQKNFKLSLLDALQKKSFALKKQIPPAQWVFCMDPRSDSVRHAIEKDNKYQTFGVAGFFNFALEYHSQQQVCRQSPVIVEPEFKVKEKETFNLFEKLFHFFSQGYAYNNKNMSSSFETYNLLGFFSYTFTIAKQFFASRFDLQQPLNCELEFEPENMDGTSINNIVEKAISLLSTIGLTDNFSPAVILCGHKATTANNPFESTLACGACGGNSGLVNAVFVAKVLNSPLIRHKLKQKGIVIPVSTRFLAAGHDTTTCQVEIVNNNDESSNVYAQISQLNDWLKQLSTEIRLQNSKLHPDDNIKTDRPYHWAETLPELGLANNATMVVGPRELSKDLTLEGRAFLHCYSSEDDNDFSNLKAIMNGPMIVAHWINMQYYASSIAPDLYGAGSKTNHNLIPGVGVIIGKYGDLKTGLPLQSVFNRNKRLHMPIKLHVYIYAPQHAIDAIINENRYLKNLVEGGWIIIACLFTGS